MIYLDDLDNQPQPARCGYAPCSATLRPDGPSLYWCNETCMTNWTKAQNFARYTLDPAGAEPPCTEPVRGATPTFVVVDEAAQVPEHVWAEVSGPTSAQLAPKPVTAPPFRPGGLIRRVLGYRSTVHLPAKDVT